MKQRETTTSANQLSKPYPIGAQQFSRTRILLLVVEDIIEQNDQHSLADQLKECMPIIIRIGNVYLYPVVVVDVYCYINALLKN